MRYSAEVKRFALELAAKGIIGLDAQAEIAAKHGVAPTTRVMMNWRSKDGPETKVKLSLEDEIRALRQSKKLPKTFTALCNALDASPQKVQAAIDNVTAEGLLINLDKSGVVSIQHKPKRGGNDIYIKPIEINADGLNVVKFGATGDWHIGHQQFRGDALTAYYNRCKEVGVQFVIHTGNYLEGVAHRHNNYPELAPGAHTFDGQVNMLAEALPDVGIPTKAISGECHEGWWGTSLGTNIGKLVELKMHEAGRTDWSDLGFMSQDHVIETASGKEIRIRAFHPGGGTSYAISYQQQKIIEAMQGGKKPDVLLTGHFHKADFMPIYRNIDAFLTGCFCDQSYFMQKKSLQAHVGGWIIELLYDDDGVIRETTAKFVRFFNKEYYEGKGD